MAKYLLAAEADQIQDFVFRASRLREVVGGSQLLVRFCTEAPVELLRKYNGIPDRDLIINDGGAFRVIFEDTDSQKAKDEAVNFGRDLAELYRRITGANLTVAEPVPYKGSFQKASKEAQEKLREAKNRGDVPAVAVHMPYLAFCSSCGIAIASQRHKRHPDERENYYCDTCLQKEKERDAEVEKLKNKKDRSGFLGLFYQAIESVCENANYESMPERFAQQADDIGAFDLTGRRYVAYLLADVNGMGAWFSSCQKENTMKELSQSLPDIMRESLAAPVQIYSNKLKIKIRRK